MGERRANMTWREVVCACCLRDAVATAASTAAMESAARHRRAALTGVGIPLLERSGLYRRRGHVPDIE